MVTLENKLKASGQTVVVKVTIKYASESKVKTSHSTAMSAHRPPAHRFILLKQLGFSNKNRMISPFRGNKRALNSQRDTSLQFKRNVKKLTFAFHNLRRYCLFLSKPCLSSLLILAHSLDYLSVA